MFTSVTCIAVLTNAPAMIMVKYKSIAVPDGTLKYWNVNKKGL
jgi:hypothetical protein